ncbi:MAG: molybdopterin-binding protein [Nitrospirae bacterium]|nr:molybdopterin-binding protein [Nitrospirota bacterium]
MVLAHDITEIRQNEFKGRAFRKGHVVGKEDICRLQRLGKEHLFVLHVGNDEMHEDDAARALADALMGKGLCTGGEPKEGKINLVADRDGVLKIDREALQRFNMLGEVMCASLHSNTVVKKGQVVAGTRAIPLVVKRKIVEEAVAVCKGGSGGKPGARRSGIIEVREMRAPRAGIVITGNEVYYGRIKDAFAPIMRKKIESLNGEVVGVYYAPDEGKFIEERLRELLLAGADLLIVTGGMSVDPDDVTRFAIRNLGAIDLAYGSAVLPGSMFLVGYIENSQGIRGPARSSASASPDDFESTGHPAPIPVLGVPACGIFHRITIFDLILPRVLSGERVGRRELAELGHGGLCLHCRDCAYPVCPFGK